MTAPLDAPAVPAPVPDAAPPPDAPPLLPAGPAGRPSSSVLLDAALAYARLGWPVTPLYEPVDVGVCSCSRRAACRDAGKHPRLTNGVSGASTDEATIRAWWGTWPAANVGIRCDSLAVVDIDPRNGGSLDQFVAEHGPLPPTPQAATGGGGVHLFFQRSPGELRGKLGPGIDLQRGEGAQVVAWPSRHRSGGQYAWCPAPWETPPAEMPPSLVQLAREGAPRARGGGAASLGPYGGSTSPRAQPDRSADDFALCLRLMNDGADNAGVFAAIVSTSDKYRDRVKRSESAAAKYARGTVEEARRVHEASLTEVSIVHAGLDVHRDKPGPPCAVVKLVLATLDGVFLDQKARLVAPSRGYSGDARREQEWQAVGAPDAERVAIGDFRYLQQVVLGHVVRVAPGPRRVSRMFPSTRPSLRDGIDSMLVTLADAALTVKVRDYLEKWPEGVFAAHARLVEIVRERRVQ